MRWALPMDDIRLTRSLLDQGYNHLDLRRLQRGWRARPCTAWRVRLGSRIKRSVVQVHGAPLLASEIGLIDTGSGATLSRRRHSGQGAPSLRPSVLMPLGTTYWQVALAATDATCQYVMRSGAARYMARASYTSTLPPEPRTGHPFAFVAASSRDSALMIE
jgi:hypothetical protein